MTQPLDDKWPLDWSHLKRFPIRRSAAGVADEGVVVMLADVPKALDLGFLGTENSGYTWRDYRGRQ